MANTSVEPEDPDLAGVIKWQRIFINAIQQAVRDNMALVGNPYEIAAGLGISIGLFSLIHDAEGHIGSDEFMRQFIEGTKAAKERSLN